MSTRLILIRQADSQHKIDGVMGGPDGCRGLTDAGRQQAARLRDRFLHEERFEGAVNLSSSPIPRAAETARILAGACGGAPVGEECDLCSCHIPPEFDGIGWADGVSRGCGGAEGVGPGPGDAKGRPHERGSAESLARRGMRM